MCTVGSCGGGRVWPWAKLAVDVAGCVGGGLGDAVAVAACAGGAFAAAGPVSVVCAGAV